MKKRANIEVDNKILVDINELQGILSLGHNSANTIGEKAGAVVRVGTRKLYNVNKIKAYIDSVEEVEV